MSLEDSEVKCSIKTYSDTVCQINPADDGYLTPFVFLDPLIFYRLSQSLTLFTLLEITPRCSAAGLYFRIIPAGFKAPLEFLTGFTSNWGLKLARAKRREV